jgi:hypothetical protein
MSTIEVILPHEAKSKRVSCDPAGVTPPVTSGPCD